ncbi:CaiB/BaiF CoA transferase family protein [Candidatus Entotheonella palauensis]|uniref:CaiB/BaiF CoA transferase family protein n=1 Tax=Candidatus Entotheonella palauensis TaxID=93172 RepID=UPI000B7C6C3A|nr:CoA transferase [Candidatus Entotheonella palauensis]
MTTPVPPSLLEGIRVIDLTWILVGPGATRILSSMGAEVIRIEPTAPTRVDLGRFVAPFIRDEPGPPDDPYGLDLSLPERLDRAGYYFNVNPGKRGIRLNLNTPEGKDLFRRLVAIGDVLTENFSAHTMDKWGFGYEALRAIKPDIIYVQMSGMGYTGPEQNYVSYGPTAQSLSGLSYQSGLPEPAPPAGWGYSYLDHTGSYYGAMAALCGLLYRQQTGEGQHIDVAQEALGLVLTGTALMDAVVNGRQSERTGNRSPYRPAAPHGAYPCAGEDRWCAIAVFSDAEWQALCEAMGHPGWTAKPVYASLESRLQHQDELDTDVASWTRHHRAEEVMQRLRAKGVRAGVVQTPEDKVRHDPQLRQRGYYVDVTHSRFGPLPVENTPIHYSETPVHPGGPIMRGAPRWGEDNDYVYGELLGLSASEIADYADRGII